jgi:hypothetical protein
MGSLAQVIYFAGVRVAEGGQSLEEAFVQFLTVLMFVLFSVAEIIFCRYSPGTAFEEPLEEHVPIFNALSALITVVPQIHVQRILLEVRRYQNLKADMNWCRF